MMKVFVTHYQGRFSINNRTNKDSGNGLRGSMRNKVPGKCHKNSFYYGYSCGGRGILAYDYASEMFQNLVIHLSLCFGRISYSDIIHPDDYVSVKDRLQKSVRMSMSI
jgi:hypothetical protein